jgi:tryptophanyl-tRNA synthetase
MPTRAKGEEFVVTPWEVKGKIDYGRLKTLFGTQELTPELLDRLRRLAGGELHPLLERGVYISHRDLGPVLAEYEKGNPFFLYSGRGPSGPLHTAHLLHFDLCGWLQAKLGVPMYIQLTDDEKYWLRKEQTREETYRWAWENLYDLLAVGFDRERTRVFFDTRSIGTMYPLAADIAKRIPYSTAKAVFGFPTSTNLGLMFYTALQSVPCFYPSWRSGRSVPCLIPCGIDQDPHFRISRDVAEPLGYPKPALLHSEMLPGLLGDRVMSTTGDVRDNAVFLNDPPKEVRRKIGNAFTGGRATVEEQRRLGAVPEICSVWAMWRSKFAPTPEKFDRVTRDCRSGALLCGDCKSDLVDHVNRFLEGHRARREAVKEWAPSIVLEGGAGEPGKPAGPPLPSAGRPGGAAAAPPGQPTSGR